MKIPRLLIAVTVLVLASALALAAWQGQSPETQLKAVMSRELLGSDLKAVIADYRSLVASFPDNHAVASKALLQMARCFERLGQSDDARPIYERIVKDYPQSGVVLATARTRLVALRPTKALASQAANAELFDRRSLDDVLRGVGVLTFSKDGSMVAYTRPVPRAPGSTPNLRGNLLASRCSLNVRVLAGGAETKLLDDQSCGSLTAAFSPDGRLLAIETSSFLNLSVQDLVAEKGPLPTNTLSIIPVIGGPARVVPVQGQTVWSPDSAWIAYGAPLTEPIVEARLFNVLTGEHRPLGGSSDSSLKLKWSLDGQRILFHSTDAQAKTDVIRVVTVKSGQSKSVPLPHSPARVTTELGRWTAANELVIWQKPSTAPAGAPDIAIAWEALMLSLDDGSVTTLCAQVPNQDECVGPTEHGFLIRKHDSKNYILRKLATGIDVPLTLSSGEEHLVGGGWDGRPTAFLSNRDGRWGLYLTLLDQIPAANPVRIATFDQKPLSWQRWFTDSGMIFRANLNDSHIARVSMDATGHSTGPVERLTQDTAWNEAPAISPDASTIGYSYRTGSRTGVALMDANGANERSLTERPQGDFGMSWRSTSELLIGRGVSPFDGIDALSVRGAAVTDTLPVKGLRFQYVPSRNEVVYSSELPGPKPLSDAYELTLRARSLVSGDDRVIGTMARGFSWASMRSAFAVSPDGNHVAYLFGQQKMIAKLCDPCELRLMTMDGAQERVLLTPLAPVEPVAWSPDGKFLLYLGPGGGPRVINVETSEHWPLMPQGQQPSWNGQGAWSPDGKFIAIAATSQRTEHTQWTGITREAVEAALAASKRR